MLRTQAVSLGKIAAACLVLHEVCSAEGNFPILGPFCIHFWIGYGGMDYLGTLRSQEGTEIERVGYLSVVYSVMNRLHRCRTIQVSLGVIPQWSSYKRRK